MNKLILYSIFATTLGFTATIMHGSDHKSDLKERLELGATPATNARPKRSVAFSPTHTRISSGTDKITERAKTAAPDVVGPDIKERKEAQIPTPQAPIEHEEEDKSWCGRNPGIVLGTLITVLCGGMSIGLGFGIKYIVSLKGNDNCLTDSNVSLNNQCWRYQMNPPNGIVSGVFCPPSNTATYHDVIAAIEHKEGLQTSFCATTEQCGVSQGGYTQCNQFNSVKPEPKAQKKATTADARTLLKMRQALNATKAQKQFNKNLPKPWKKK